MNNDIFNPALTTIADYYKVNDLTPENEYLKTYLGYGIMEDSTKSTPTKSKPEKIDISKILSESKFTGLNKPTVINKDNTNVSSNIIDPISKSVPQIVPKTKKDFIKIYAQAAKEASKESGISEDLMLAQIALESGWGKHAPGYNLGGIKADNSWKGKSKISLTKEQGPNGLEDSLQKFRVYDSPQEGFKDYVKFLSVNKRYKPLKGILDPYKAAEIMGRTGYATDANYTSKLKNMIKSIQEVKKSS